MEVSAPTLSAPVTRNTVFLADSFNFALRAACTNFALSFGMKSTCAPP